MRVDFPKPDTPVTAMNFPRKRAVMFCVVLTRPITLDKADRFNARRSDGTGMGTFS